MAHGEEWLCSLLLACFFAYYAKRAADQRRNWHGTWVGCGLVSRAVDSRGVVADSAPVVDLPGRTLLHFLSSSTNDRNRLGWPTTGGLCNSRSS
jgi:hypothetical protein